jgi:metal iron transporter
MCSCPSRTDEPYEGEGHNQSPNHLAADLTTNQDLNGIANAREIRNQAAHAIPGSSRTTTDNIDPGPNDDPGEVKLGRKKSSDDISIGRLGGAGQDGDPKKAPAVEVEARSEYTSPPSGGSIQQGSSRLSRFKQVILAYAQFVGPGFMIAVAYSS